MKLNFNVNRFGQLSVCFFLFFFLVQPLSCIAHDFLFFFQIHTYIYLQYNYIIIIIIIIVTLDFAIYSSFF